MKSVTPFTVATATACTYFFGIAEAFWRLECHGIAGFGRVDPIVNPGTAGNHAHAVFGSGAFGMSSSAEDLLKSDCTSCSVTQDKSAYWTPPLYFVDSNGKAEMVPNQGGMLAYYEFRADEQVEPFPNGFTMLAGDHRLRNYSLPNPEKPDPPKSEWSGIQVTQEALAQKALGFNCLHYGRLPNEDALTRHYLPKKSELDAMDCTDGIRIELMFPSCWNGKDLDTSDHKSHVAYPSLVNGGDCPKGFETKMVRLFYETIWRVQDYKGRAGEFVLSNGDPTGYGYHGDFISAWEGDTLKQAVKRCRNKSGEQKDCDVFNLQSSDKSKTCKFEIPTELKGENCHGPRDGLPGDVKIQAGPEYAAAGAGADGAKASPASPSSSPEPSSSPAPAAAVSSQGGGYGVAVGGLFAEVSSSSSTSSPSLSPPSAAASPPYTTAPPSPPAPGVPDAVSTTYVTKGREVYEIVVVDQEVTVTSTSTLASGKHRRHIHRHQHKHGQLH